MEFCIHENINTLIENFKAAVSHHFQPDITFGVEIVISSKDNFSSITDNNLAKLTNELSPFEKSAHLPFRDLHLASTDRYIVEYSINNIKKGIDIAGKLGVKKCVLHTTFSPLLPKSTFFKRWFPKFIESKKEIENYAAEKENISIAWENVWEKDFTLFDMILDQEPFTKFCLDVGHANCFSIFTQTQFIEKYKKNITHLHLHDNMGDEDSHISLGAGNINFYDILDLIDKNNITHTTFELNKPNFIKSLYLIDPIITNYGERLK